MHNSERLVDDFVQMARIAMTGRAQDVQLLIHRAIKRYRADCPDMAEKLTALLRESPTRASPLRRQSEIPLPVDNDSRLQLLRVESEIVLEHDMIASAKVELGLAQIITERQRPEALHEAGLQPTRTLLFTGPPGVGKTMAARKLARDLRRPLLILDLAAVMSSFLGRTGSNLRQVLDYAKSIECVLLLDELDALAKRRDDRGEIGELKRLVTVLLQEVDDWPSSGLLVAATNHADLLDPAVWRRFEMLLQFELPQPSQIAEFSKLLLNPYIESAEMWAEVLGLALRGHSHSDIEREITQARRATIVSGLPLATQLKILIRKNSGLSRMELVDLARLLTQTGITSQREAREITGVARDTIRKPPRAKSGRRHQEEAA